MADTATPAPPADYSTPTAAPGAAEDLAHRGARAVDVVDAEIVVRGSELRLAITAPCEDTLVKRLGLAQRVYPSPPGPARRVIPLTKAPAALAKVMETGPVSPHLVALAGVVAAARGDAARAVAVPSLGLSSRWDLPPSAPSPAALRALAAARAQARGDEPAQLGHFYQAARRTQAPAPQGAPGELRPSSRLARAWTERVAARLGTGAKLALRILPPEAPDGPWHVAPALYSLDDEPLEAVPGIGDPATAHARAHLRASEWELAAVVLDLPAEAPADPVALADDRLDDLVEAIGRLSELGIDVYAPSGRLTPRRLHTGASAHGQPAGMTRETLELRVRVDIDGNELTDADLATLSRSHTDLVELATGWVLLDAADRARARDLLTHDGDLVAPAALLAGAALGPGLDPADVDVDEVGGWVGDALRGEWHLDRVDSEPVPEDFALPLRDYQVTGYQWLRWLEGNGVGGILADDMGTGKTATVLAAVLADRAGPTLVVAPASVVTNWAREAARFAPTLVVAVHHGRYRDLEALDPAPDLVVTSYGLLRSDETLAARQWHRLVLDEAQAVKTHVTQTARAAAALDATHRLAVTGTPVENHVGDLWSLMKVVNPGLLGPRKRFMARFGGSVLQDGAVTQDTAAAHVQLRRLITPFVLRRTKSDPDVALGIPDKIVTRQDCGLTTEQIGLYQGVSEELLATLEETTTRASRSGAILTGIMRLKQICTHPMLLSPSGDGIAGRSGKLSRTEELLDEVRAAEEAAILFTQWTRWLPALATHLAQRFGVEVAVFDGTMGLRHRQEIIDAFSEPTGPPLLVCSLKAGGVGLNLTRANHVVHLDRWWNPAVETQAEDRTHRVGQHRTVQVHTLVCPGTLEDRIDALLAEKQATADAVVGSTERAVTELSNAELAELVTLVREEIPR